MYLNRFWIVIGLCANACIGINQQDLIGDSDRPLDTGNLGVTLDSGEVDEDGSELGGEAEELIAENIVSSILETDDPENTSAANWEETLQVFVDEYATLTVEHTVLWDFSGVTTVDVEWDGDTQLNVFYDQSQPIEKNTWVQVSYSISLASLPSAEYTLSVEDSEVQFRKE